MQLSIMYTYPHTHMHTHTHDHITQFKCSKFKIYSLVATTKIRADTSGETY